MFLAMQDHVTHQLTRVPHSKHKLATLSFALPWGCGMRPMPIRGLRALSLPCNSFLGADRRVHQRCYTAMPIAAAPAIVAQSPTPDPATGTKQHSRGGRRGPRHTQVRTLVDAGQTKDWGTILWITAGNSDYNHWYTDCANNCAAGVGLWNDPGQPPGFNDQSFTTSGPNNQSATQLVSEGGGVAPRQHLPRSGEGVLEWKSDLHRNEYCTSMPEPSPSVQ